MENTQDTCK